MKQVLIAALLATAASGALAADLPTAKGAPPAPYYAPLPFTWTGGYVGLNGGIGWADLTNTNFTSPYGGVFGGQAGYNLQMNQFVIGLEADLEGGDMVSTNTYALGKDKFGVHAMTTERARAGIALDRMLIYVTGGYAGVSTTASYADTVNGISGFEGKWRNGGAVGAGLEYAVTPNITVRGEYLFLGVGDATYFKGTPDSERDTLSVSLARAGVNFKF